MTEGDIVYLKFEDDSVIKLTNTRLDIAIRVTNDWNRWMLHCKLKLDEKIVALMLTKKITKIRIAGNDYTLTKKGSEKLMDQMKAITKN